jgi:hypothetical protein
MIGLHASSLDDSGSDPMATGRRMAAPAGHGPLENLVDTSLRVAQTLLPPGLHSVSLSSSESRRGENPSPVPSASAGDYGHFFRATLGPLRRYIARLVGSREEAQDIAQDAYAKVFTVMQDRAVAHPRALLYTTARNLAIVRFIPMSTNK